MAKLGGIATSAALLLAGCGGSTQTPPTTTPTEEAVAFENPGGMWMPSQLASHGETLSQLGVAFPPEALTDPTQFPLGAVVSLGGCSASFVSPDGLIVTNHHCVIRALQHNSTPDQNLLKDGFLAKTRGEEILAWPGQRVYVSTAFTDVTDKIVTGLDEIADDASRAREIERRRNEVAKTCEAGKPDMRCRVASYFDGAQYVQIEQLQIKDVRLVYSPDDGIGVFGGEIDNWRWPRHTGDYSFLRAYVGPDGKPAKHSAENVPYKPPHYLKVATESLKEGDFVMVAGYPGRTFRMKTASEVQAAVDWYYPGRIERFTEYIALYERLAKEDPELAIATTSQVRRIGNSLTNSKGMRDGLSKGLAADKAKLEADLQKWIDEDDARKAKYGTVIADLAALQAAREKTRDGDAAVRELARATDLLTLSIAVRKMVEEVAKPEGERHAAVSPEMLEGAAPQMAKLIAGLNPKLDRAVLELAVKRVSKLPDGQRPDAVLQALLGDAAAQPLDEAKLGKALDKLFAKTKLLDEKGIAKALKLKPKKLDKSKDPWLKASSVVLPLMEDIDEREKAYEGAMSKLRPLYIAALREFSPTPLAPDANGTLRVTYGTVRGYQPTPDAETYFPFTKLSEMVAKQTGEHPFDAPDRILEAAKAEDFGPYADEAVGEVPVNFLADLDITGGNSGSATLNARGELIGLVFDGNYESIASDWLFEPAVTRSIHVDFRYVMWIMDAVDDADHLLTEMGVTPSLGGAAAAPATADGAGDAKPEAPAAPAAAAAAPAAG